MRRSRPYRKDQTKDTNHIAGSIWQYTSGVQEGLGYYEINAKVIQASLNHCKVAQDLVAQTVADERADVLLISELYKISDFNPWIHHKSKQGAMWPCGSKCS